MRIARVENGKLDEIYRQRTDTSTAGFAKFLGALQEVAVGSQFTAVAGGVPGQLRGEDGGLAATNLPNWSGLPVLARLKEIFDCPVYVGNDVELCGIGEARYGAGIAKGIMAYYTVSTGVNAARLVDGVVDRTISRYELGKQVVNHTGGQAQTLESLIGGAALEKRLGTAPHDIKDATVWSQLARYLAAGLYNTSLYWDPEIIVLGGTMMRDIDPTEVAAEIDAMPVVFDKRPRLALAKLGDEAGLYGAVAWLDQLGYK